MEASDPASQRQGLNTLDPAAVQSSNPCSTPGVCVSVCVYLGDGVKKKREHLEQEYYALWSRASWEEILPCTWTDSSSG